MFDAYTLKEMYGSNDKFGILLRLRKMKLLNNLLINAQ